MYRVNFLNCGKVYEIYARKVSQGTMQGFVEVDELVFDQKSELVVDPSEERLKTEFAGVKRAYVPLHAVLRIDEVEKKGKARIAEAGERGSKVMQFPVYHSDDPGS